MICAHIIMNALFLLFSALNVQLLLNKETIRIIENKVKHILLVSFIFGLITYLTYIFMLFKFITTDGVDQQSFSLLILSWAFMFAAKQVVTKQLVKSEK